MTQPPRFERMPIDSREPLVGFAEIRVLIAVAALIGTAIAGFPYGGAMAVTLAALVLPWSLAVLAVTRRSVDAGLSTWIVAGDIAVLAVLQGIEPEIYGAVHFMALFLVAAHAHFQGQQRALLGGVLAPAVLIPVTIATDVPLADDVVAAYEALFAVATVSVAVVVGALRTAESSGRLRARALSRRTIDTEAEVRRRLSEAIHDGPIQELSSVELMLASAEQAFARGDLEQGQHALSEARSLTRHNVTFLRDEIVELGPHAFEELSLEQAIADCIETWQRRYGFTVKTDIAAEGLPPDVAGALFRVTQEAVTNAGKHAEAQHVTVRVRRARDGVTLEVSDDGGGFGGIDPLGPSEPGHIGLESMRERAEMLGGRLAIQSGDRGTRVRVSIPL